MAGSAKLEASARALVRQLCPTYDGDLAAALDTIREGLGELEPGVLLIKLNLLELRARALPE